MPLYTIVIVQLLWIYSIDYIYDVGPLDIYHLNVYIRVPRFDYTIDFRCTPENIPALILSRVCLPAPLQIHSTYHFTNA